MMDVITPKWLEHEQNRMLAQALNAREPSLIDRRTEANEAMNAPAIRRDRLIDRAATGLKWAAVGALIAVVATAAFAAPGKLRADLRMIEQFREQSQ